MAANAPTTVAPVTSADPAVHAPSVATVVAAVPPVVTMIAIVPTPIAVANRLNSSPIFARVVNRTIELIENTGTIARACSTCHRLNRPEHTGCNSSAGYAEQSRKE